MKKLRSFAISLVVLVSMLFSFQGFSQSSPLAFDIVYPSISYSTVYDLGDHSFAVSAGDALFYFEFNRAQKTYKYYGIIDSVSNSVVDLKLHLETDRYFYNGDVVVDINGTDITGTIQNDAVLPMKTHSMKDTSIAINTKLNFDTLNILADPFYGAKVSFKFSFTFTPSVGFEDNFFVEKETFKVYPNPCENQLNIEADGLKRVFDTSGRLMLETYENVVNMSDLAPGMYVVMLESGATKKVIKRN